MLKRTLIAVSLLVVCCLVLSPAPSQASPQGIPAGIYVTNITEADVPPGLPPEVAAALVGEWSLELTDSGVYIVEKDGAFAVMGSYVSNSARLVMHDELGPLSCSGPGEATGVYDWSFDGEFLTLSAVHDGCTVRTVPATSHPFQLQ
jgi:hypothetical protein